MVQAATNATCNAWTFCGVAAGCLNEQGALVPYGACNLYSSHDLMYNVPLDSKNATLRGANVTFTSGAMLAVDEAMRS